MSALLSSSSGHGYGGASHSRLAPRLVRQQEFEQPESNDRDRPWQKESMSSSPRSQRAHRLQPSISVTSHGTHVSTSSPHKMSKISVPVQPIPKPTGVRRFAQVFKRLYKRLMLKHLIPLLVIMIYMALGAVIFQWIEYGADDALKKAAFDNYLREKELFVKRVKEIVRDTSSAYTLDTHVREAVNYYENRIHFFINAESEWTFWSAMYYCGTIYSTIGYGDIACQTTAGRIATVFYAIVGIPLMLTTLNDLGKWLFGFIKKSMQYWGIIEQLIEQYLCCCCSTRLRGVFFSKPKPKYTLVSSRSAPSDSVKVNMEPAGQIQLSKSLSVQESLEMVVVEGSLAERPPPDPTITNEAAGKEGNLLKPPPDPTNMNEAAGKEGHLLKPPPMNVDLTRKDTISSDSEDEVDIDDIVDREPTPRIPVSVALGVTLGWIFFCAGLFCIWEHDWTYGEACYFFFISLSTIGLGDVTPKRRDLMVLSFAFVIIGLSLVSMCINVIQGALEDLYMQLLMKIFLDYQRKMDEGGDQVGASMGMMQMWGNSKSAKFLMPLLSKEKKQNVVQKFQEEAKEQGIELPPVLQQVDLNSGLPKILALQEKAADALDSGEVEIPLERLVEQTILKAEDDCVAAAAAAAVQLRHASPPLSHHSSKVSVIHQYDSDTQTDAVLTDDKQHQTFEPELHELAVQTELSSSNTQCYQVTQTEKIDVADGDVQTVVVEQIEDAVQTLSVVYHEADSQTQVAHTKEQELQTHVFESVECDAQTESPTTKNQRLQTPYPESKEQECQTDELELAPPLKTPTKLAKARKRLQRAFGKKPERGRRRNSHGDAPAMSGWKDVEGEQIEEEDEDEALEGEESEGSVESLHWNPVDGMHAEKQRGVRDLKAMFEQSRKNQTIEK